MRPHNETLYFDGNSTVAKAVMAEGVDGTLILSVEDGVLRCTPVDDIVFSITQDGTFAIGYFADGASLQITDALLIAKLKSKNTIPALLASSWRGAFVAFMALVALVFCIYRWGIPAVADEAANLMPDAWAKNIEASVMKEVDSNMCKTSELPDSRQIKLLQRFSALQMAATPIVQAAPEAKLIFRSCALMGPNAFNIGREIIVLTDEMVKFAGNDDAVLGILAHELGHLESDHVMRGILRYAGVGLVATALLGDVSSIVAAAPTLVMRNQFTQVFEREADAHALARLKAANISTKPLATVFKKLNKNDDSGEGDGKRWEWMLSHPDSGERAKLFDE